MTQQFNFYGTQEAAESATEEYSEEDLIGYSSAHSYLATQQFEPTEVRRNPPPPITPAEIPPVYSGTQAFGNFGTPADELGDIFDNAEGPASPEAEEDEDSEAQSAAQMYQTQMFNPRASQSQAAPLYQATQQFAVDPDEIESPASPKADESEGSRYQSTQMFDISDVAHQSSESSRYQPNSAEQRQVPNTQSFEDVDENELLGDTADLDEGESSQKPVEDDNDSDGGVGTKKKRAVMLEESDQESEAGEILRDIFGASDEEGEEGEFAGFNEKEPDGSVSDSGVAEDQPGRDTNQVDDNDDDDDTDVRSSLPQDFEYDFDVMMRKRKAENSRARKKRKDVDIVNDADDLISFLCEQMREAAREDRELNGLQKPAMRKRKLLPQILQQLKKQDLQASFIEGGIISAMTEWISPLPDKSLPAMEIRTEFLKLLNQFPTLPTDILKSSSIGKAVMYLQKNPKETRENRALAAKLISDWARPIFNIQTDFRSLTKEERVQRDLDHMPQAKKKRTNSIEQPAEPEKTRPGEKGFIPRARVPQPSTRDYVVRPKWNIGDGENVEKRLNTGKKTTLLDRKMREFKEKTKQSKSQRAVTVSVSGNKM